jgi:hypothetical protein
MEQEGGSAGLPFDLLDDTMDTLSEAVLDCMPSPPDSAALYRQLGLSDGTDHLGLDMNTNTSYGMGTGTTPGVFHGDPPAQATGMFAMPDTVTGSKAEVGLDSVLAILLVTWCPVLAQSLDSLYERVDIARLQLMTLWWMPQEHPGQEEIHRRSSDESMQSAEVSHGLDWLSDRPEYEVERVPRL